MNGTVCPLDSEAGLSIADALEYAERCLRESHCVDIDNAAELASESRALVRCAGGLTDAQIFADRQRSFPAQNRSRLVDIVERRAAGEPLAYIEGARGFHAIELGVNAHVLVPRPETELIVDYVIEHARLATFSALDLGTGSGAIALALACARPDAHITAVDVSAEALGVAAKNADALAAPVSFVLSDWCAALPGSQFDFICCNPPYVRSTDPHLARLRFEPRLALDGGDDGLFEIRRVMADAPGWLAPGGRLVIEHGYDQAPSVAAIAEGARLRLIETLRDLAGHTRVSVFGAGD